MALPDSAKIVRGTTICFAGSDYSPTDSDQPAKTSGADFTITNLATGGVARESDKVDLGSVNLDLEYEMRAYVEFHSAPTAGGTVDFYAAYSGSSTAANDNPGNLSGVDAVYQGYGADTASGTEGLKQLEYIGSLVVTADTDIQVANIGVFSPKNRYIMLVMVNNASVAVAATDGVETGVAITPLTTQIQD